MIEQLLCENILSIECKTSSHVGVERRITNRGEFVVQALIDLKKADYNLIQEEEDLSEAEMEELQKIVLNTIKQ